jgi:uncharacterized tellurite resistance protein B-like protein
MKTPEQITEEANNNIIVAAIKMMLIDGKIDSRELAKIKEIYQLLFGHQISSEKVKELIFKVMAQDDFGCEVSDIANSISESIRGKRSRELATIALAEVMIADQRLHVDEQELVILITELWDTEDILQDYLNDS